MTTTLIVILVSLLLSAFFSGAEAAYLSSNKLFFEIERKKDGFRGAVLDSFHKNPEKFITSISIGNTIALVIYGIGMIKVITPGLMSLSDSIFFIIIAQILIITFLIIIIGEFIPKMVSRIHPNLFLKFWSIPLYFFLILIYPFTFLLSFMAKILFKIAGVNYKNKKTDDPVFGKEDLDYIIQQKIEELPEDDEVESEVRYFQNALDFSNVKVRNCIVPRTEIVAVDIQTPFSELIARFIETGLSKILVYKEDIDDITGYIHSSEMFKKPTDWTHEINPVSIVPENMPASRLMDEMLKEKKNIVVVVDEFGGTAGIVTLEDLVEEIFGEFEDEHDTRSYVFKKLSDKEYIFSGRVEIDKINEEYNLNLPESDEYVTIAGYILNYYKNFPKVNETIPIHRFTFKIIKVTNTKIELVRVKVEE